MAITYTKNSTTKSKKPRNFIHNKNAMKQYATYSLKPTENFRKNSK